MGLDIGSSSIKAVELKSTKAGYELVSFGLEPLAQDTVVDGAIMDAPQVANAITKIFDTQKDENKERGHFGFRALGDRKAGSAAIDDRGRACMTASHRKPANTFPSTSRT